MTLLKSSPDPDAITADVELERSIIRERRVQDRERTRRALGLAPFAHSVWWIAIALDSAREAAVLAGSFAADQQQSELQNIATEIRDLRRRVAVLET